MSLRMEIICHRHTDSCNRPVTSIVKKTRPNAASRLLAFRAREAGWLKIGDDWICPNCQEAGRPGTASKPSVSAPLDQKSGELSTTSGCGAATEGLTVARLVDAMRTCRCPVPVMPDDKSVGACFDRGWCGCDCGTALIAAGREPGPGPDAVEQKSTLRGERGDG